MKKTFTLIIIFTVANIYKSNGQKFYIGANGGFLKNATIIENNTSHRPDWNKERINTFNGGINIGYKFSKHWNIETQIQFIKLRYYERLDYLFHPTNNSGGWLPVKIDWYNNHNYIRIPIVLHYNFIPNHSIFGVSLFAGPDLGYNTKQTTAFIGVNEIGKSQANSLKKMEIPLKKIDFGFQIGLRIKSQLHKSFSIFIDGKVYQGFPSIIDYPTPSAYRYAESYEFYNIVNRHFTTNIGLLYSFKYKK